uniref:Transmembrane protein 109 n=1 Tax=Gasterosteus aculeatus aculeatus TaxID=481459 RepID=G3PV17_GASAC
MWGELWWENMRNKTYGPIDMIRALGGGTVSLGGGTVSLGGGTVSLCGHAVSLEGAHVSGSARLFPGRLSASCLPAGGRRGERETHFIATSLFHFLIGTLSLSIMSRRSPRSALLGGLCVLLAAALLSVSGEKDSESRYGSVREAVAELAGEQTVRSVHKAFSQVLAAVAGGLSAGLNVLCLNASRLLQAAGVHATLPISEATPDGVVFVAQWLLVTFIGYWLISLVFRCVASALRRALWLLKVGVAVVCFGFILSDRSAGSDAMAVRLAVLVCVCVLLGVGTLGSPDVAGQTARLEKQVKVLETRLREMERRRRTQE